jgi:putative endonuclease
MKSTGKYISKVTQAPHVSSGQEAEKRAACFLESQGVQIIDRNYRVKMGEIDIVAIERDILIFVEVRWRKNNLFGGAIESIDKRKLKRLQLAAACYIHDHPCLLPCRFDVLCQDGNRNTEWLWVRGLL